MSNAVLKGKTAVVTGASSGIGQATAHLLAEDGAAVVIVGRTEDTLLRTRNSILAKVADARIEVCRGDATHDADVRKAVEQAYAIAGRLDILIPTVGGPEYKPVAELDPAGVLAQFELNFMTAFRLVHHGSPMLSSGGSIVCVSTAAVGQANSGLSAYASAKAALERFVRGAAFELGSRGLRINAVRPGATLSAEAIRARNLARVTELYAAETPLGRVGDPYEVARVIRFLAGPESSWVTGETLSVDGGMQQGKAPDLMSVL